MHASPAKHSYVWLPRKCDYRTDTHTHTRTDRQTDAGQSDPYVPLCFADDTKSKWHNLQVVKWRRHRQKWLILKWEKYSTEWENIPTGKCKVNSKPLKNWMLIFVLLCENECQRWDASRYIKARSEAQRFYVYRDASHLWHSFSHNRTKINIQNL